MTAKIITFFVVIALLVIGIFAATNSYNISVNTAKKSQAQIKSVDQEIIDNGVMKYDQLEVTGAEVINAIRKYQTEMKVSITTKKASAVYPGITLELVNTKTSDYYIDPNMKFIGKVVKNTNGVVTQLHFSEKGLNIIEVPDSTDDDRNGKYIIADAIGSPATASDTWLKLAEFIKKMKDEYENGVIDKDQLIATLKQAIAQLEAEVEKLKERIAELEEQEYNAKLLISNAIGLPANVNNSWEEMARYIEEIKNSALEGDINTTLLINQLKNKIAELEKQILDLEDRIHDLEKELEEKDKIIADKDAEIQKLKDQLNNRSMATITGRINSQTVKTYQSVIYSGYSEWFGTNCGHDSTGDYYDVNLNRKLNLNNVVLTLGLTGVAQYYNSGSGYGGSYKNTSSFPTGKLYNDASGNTILRLYTNGNDGWYSSGAGSGGTYSVEYVLYSITYLE